MPPTNLLRDHHTAHDASFLRFGDDATGADVVETFGPVELEYAALRKGAGLFDAAHRGVLRVTGEDVHTFLNSMLTQELKDLGPMRSTRTFWLNRKGRIDADIRLVRTGDGYLFDLDVLSVARTIETLSAYVIVEEVEITDASEEHAVLTLVGPTAASTLARFGNVSESSGVVSAIEIAGASVLVDRHEQYGVPGFELFVPRSSLVEVHTALLAHAEEDRLREVGWHALNVARIEAGTPVYHVDFGPDSLPAESGVLDDRVSFTKGCYLGQEVVARMHALGHPKQTLAAFRVGGDAKSDPNAQPTTGAPVFPAGTTDPQEEKPVGAVTSSARSPMLGDEICCLAQLKWASAQAGERVSVLTAAGLIETEVAADLAFYAPASS